MQAIFFDANGVLYYRVDKHDSMRAFLERHHLPVPLTEMVRQATAAVRERAFIGAISKATYYDAVLAAWGATDPRLRAEGHRVQDTAQAAIILYTGACCGCVEFHMCSHVGSWPMFYARSPTLPTTNLR